MNRNFTRCLPIERQYVAGRFTQRDRMTPDRRAEIIRERHRRLLASDRSDTW